MSAFSETTASVAVPIILLFTKVDVLAKNLETHHFQDFFPEYTGLVDVSSICEYFAAEFRRLDRRSDRALHMSVVNAADPDEFRKAFTGIESTVFTGGFREFASDRSRSINLGGGQLPSSASTYTELTPPREASPVPLSPEIGKIYCSVCQKWFTGTRENRELNLRGHTFHHTHQLILDTDCPLCNKRLITEDNLRKHLLDPTSQVVGINNGGQIFGGQLSSGSRASDLCDFEFGLASSTAEPSIAAATSGSDAPF